MSDDYFLDCDTHFSDHEPRMWTAIADEVALPALPEVAEHSGQLRLLIGDQLFPKPEGPGQGNPRGLGHLIGPGLDSDRQKFMAENSIAAATLQPGFVGLSFQAVAETHLRVALAEAYNLLASRACATSGVELRWAVLLSVEDPGWSHRAVERHANDPHLVGAVVRPTARTAAVRLSDAAFGPVLRLLAERALALFVHGGTGCYQWSPLADAYASYTLTHTFGHMGEQMIALTDLLTRADGLPDALRVVLLESGISWIPPVLSRLDGHVRRLSSGAGTPSEAFLKHVAVAPDPGESHVVWALNEIGMDNVVFGSDYPHWDTVRAGEWREVFGQLCPMAALWENTQRFVPRLVESVAVGT